MKKDIIEELGSLALATRLKNLSERLSKDVARVYRVLELDFEPRWFAMIYALKDGEVLAVTTLAQMLQQTHPAINQVANVLVKKGIIEESKGENDLRKRMLKLSKKGEALVSQMEIVWTVIKEANDELLRASTCDFLEAIRSLEQALNEKDMYERVQEKMGGQ